MLFAAAVHTTGINWDGVLANVASITVVLGVAATAIIRNIRRSIKDQIESVVDKKVTPVLEHIEGTLSRHDTRITRLEGIEEGRRSAIAQAGVTSVGG